MPTAQTQNPFRTVAAWAMVLALSGCTGSFNTSTDRALGTATGPRGNGAGYGVISDLDPLCAIDSTQGDQLHVSCRIVTHTEAGVLPIAALPSHVSVQWQVPAWLSGAEIAVVEATPSADGLAFEVTLRVAQGTTAQVRFAFLARDGAGASEIRPQILTLPYSVETYGQVTTVENIFQSGAHFGPAGGFGLLTRDIFSAEMSLPLTTRQTQPICRLRGHIFIAASSTVYWRNLGKYRLFAGKLDGAQAGHQIKDATKRAIGFYPALACQEGKTADDDRLFIVGSPDRNHGLGAFWVTRLKPDRSGEFFVSPPNMKVRHISGVSLGQDGTLFLLTADDDAPRILAFSKDGTFSVVANITLPPDLRFAPPRPNKWDENFPGALAIAPNGDFWVTLARANAVLAVKRDGTSRLLASPAEFDAPLGIDVHSSGDALVADHYHNRVVRIDPASGVLSTYLGGPTAPPPRSETVGPVAGIGPTRPVGILLDRRTLHLSFDPAESDVSGHLGYVELDPQGNPLSWQTILGGRLPLLPAGRLIKEAASIARSGGQVGGGFFLGALGVAEYRRDGALCYLERIPSRLSCLIPDALGKLRTQEILGHYKAESNPQRALTAVDSRAFGITGVTSFSAGQDGAYYVTQAFPPLIHKISWNRTLLRFERVTIAGSGKRGNTLSAADALDADFLRPSAVTTHADGSIYVSDYLELNRQPVDARIKRLVLQPNGKYRLETIAGNGVVGAIAPGVDVLASPLFGAYDLKFNTQGELVITQPCVGACGGIFRLTSTHTWEKLAGGGAALGREGEALNRSIRPRNFAFGAGDDIYFVDGAFAVRRLYRPRPGAPYRMGTVVDRDPTSPACTGGAVASNVRADQIESTWRASLNSICIGNLWGLALRDRCATTGELELVMTENFADDSVQSLLVIAKRACR